MHAYWPKSTPIAKGLVEDINAMHAYGRSSAPIAQGLVYDINALHAFWLRELKRTYGSVSTTIAQGLVEIINAKGKKIVMSPKAQGLVSNTHHGKKRMWKHCTHDSMNAGKGAKRTTSGSAGKKTTYSDEINHAVTSLLPKENDSSRWVSTLAPLTLLKAASKHAAKLNENRMLYNVSDATKAAIMTPTIVNFGLQKGGGKEKRKEGKKKKNGGEQRFLSVLHLRYLPMRYIGNFSQISTPAFTEPAPKSRINGTTQAQGQCTLPMTQRTIFAISGFCSPWPASQLTHGWRSSS